MRRWPTSWRRSSRPGNPWSREFRDRFPDVRVLPPDQYLLERQKEHGERG
jgi:hypothetical protein